MTGLYLHVPFCDGKCPYCDFYSTGLNENRMDQYAALMAEEFHHWAEVHSGTDQKQQIDTVYFGGGTPNLLGKNRLALLLKEAARAFFLLPAAEITVEANPSRISGQGPEFDQEDLFTTLRAAGFNRLSLGLQSANEKELKFLGRRHSAEDAARAVHAARKAGFENISLDLMLGLPGGNQEKLKRSMDFAASLGVEHISSYILKVEKNTPFGVRNLQVPEEDETADQYLFCVEELKKLGYAQYEISNFAKPGRESRHNLVYWHGDEYLGFGPGAHSYYQGQRYYYPRDLNAFLSGNGTVADGRGGSFEEFAMLNLRLTEGLSREACRERFGTTGAERYKKILENTKKCPPGFLRADTESISFTPEGFLVSNALILRLLPDL